MAISHSSSTWFSSKAFSACLYKTLGVESDATNKEIKDAFYKLSKYFHPDISRDESTRPKFEEIKQAYEILGNPNLRQKYDRGLINPIKGSIIDEAVRSETDDTDQIRGASSKTFDTFYADMYNKRLNEAWQRTAKAEFLKTSAEARTNEVNFILTGVLIFIIFMELRHLYIKYTEDPFEGILPDDENFRGLASLEKASFNVPSRSHFV